MNAATYIALTALAGVFAAFATIADITADDEADQQRLYCDMVTIHKDTKGQYGWPDYNQNFERICK